MPASGHGDAVPPFPHTRLSSYRLPDGGATKQQATRARSADRTVRMQPLAGQNCAVFVRFVNLVLKNSVKSVFCFLSRFSPATALQIGPAACASLGQSPPVTDGAGFLRRNKKSRKRCLAGFRNMLRIKIIQQQELQPDGS